MPKRERPTGKAERAERREKRKHAVEWQWASAPRRHAEGLLGTTEGSPDHRAARARSPRVRKLRKGPRVYILQVTIATQRQPDNPNKWVDSNKTLFINSGTWPNQASHTIVC